jgi:hypothetical protein
MRRDLFVFSDALWVVASHCGRRCLDVATAPFRSGSLRDLRRLAEQPLGRQRAVVRQGGAAPRKRCLDNCALALGGTVRLHHRVCNGNQADRLVSPAPLPRMGDSLPRSAGLDCASHRSFAGLRNPGHHDPAMVAKPGVRPRAVPSIQFHTRRNDSLENLVPGTRLQDTYRLAPLVQHGRVDRYGHARRIPGARLRRDDAGSEGRADRCDWHVVLGSLDLSHDTASVAAHAGSRRRSPVLAGLWNPHPPRRAWRRDNAQSPGGLGKTTHPPVRLGRGGERRHDDARSAIVFQPAGRRFARRSQIRNGGYLLLGFTAARDSRVAQFQYRPRSKSHVLPLSDVVAIPEANKSIKSWNHAARARPLYLVCPAKSARSFREFERDQVAHGNPATVFRKWGVPLLWVYPYHLVEAWQNAEWPPSRVDRLSPRQQEQPVP